MTPPPDTEEQKARMRLLNARAEILFAALLLVVDADPVLSDWRFARADLAHGEYVLALEEITGAYVRLGRAPPSDAVPLIRELAGLMRFDPDSPILALLAEKKG